MLRLGGELLGFGQVSLPGFFIAADHGVDCRPQPVHAGLARGELFGLAQMLEHLVPLLRLAVKHDHRDPILEIRRAVGDVLPRSL